MNEFHISYHISISLLPWWKPSPRRRSSVLSVSLSPIFPILSSLLSSLVLTAASVLTNYSVWGWCRVSPERDFSQQLCKQTKPIRTFQLPPTRSLQPGHVTNFSNHISTRICAYYFSEISCLHKICLVCSGSAAFLLSIMRRILSDEFPPSTVTEFHDLNSDILGVVLVRNHFRSHCTFHSDRILLIQIISVKWILSMGK